MIVAERAVEVEEEGVDGGERGLWVKREAVFRFHNLSRDEYTPKVRTDVSACEGAFFL
jgi:hypothetical protein